MTVAQLIELLKLQPQDLQVIIPCNSEQVIVNSHAVCVVERCEARVDGWVHDARPDKARQQYLLISD